VTLVADDTIFHGIRPSIMSCFMSHAQTDSGTFLSSAACPDATDEYEDRQSLSSSSAQQCGQDICCKLSTNRAAQSKLFITAGGMERRSKLDETNKLREPVS
jgi:hypothetical protein